VVLKSRDAQESVRIHPKYVLRRSNAITAKHLLFTVLIMFTAKVTMLECRDNVHCEHSTQNNICEFTMN
jgi:hypothetical protein